MDKHQVQQMKLHDKWSKVRKKVTIAAFCLFLIVSGSLTIILNSTEIKNTVMTFIQAEIAQRPGMESLIRGTTKGIEEVISSKFIAKERYINLVGLTDRMLGKQYINDVDPKRDVVKDNQGLLHFVTRKVRTKKYTDRIIMLNNKLREVGIPLLYVQTPLKIKPGFTELPPSIEDYSTRNTNTFLSSLFEGGVDYFDLRQAADKDQLDQLSMFYRTDHHWTNPTAFWAVQEVVNKLETEYGMTLDPNRYFTNPAQYTFTTHEKVFLGSQGRRVGKYYGGVDDYTLIMPNFETYYKVRINKNGGKLSTKEGNFANTIVYKDLLDMDSSVYTNRYAAYFGADYREVQITNKKADNQYRILIVKDSFALPFTAFLSTMVNDIRMIDLRYFTPAHLDTYINEYKPDAVLFVYKGMNLRYNLMNEIMKLSQQIVAGLESLYDKLLDVSEKMR